MKKFVVFASICALAGLFACAKSGEMEIKATMIAMTKLHDATADTLDKAASAKEAGDALVKYAAEMKVLALKSKDLATKYPELAKEDGKSEKFKAEKEALKNSMEKFTKSLTAVTIKYASAKELMDALNQMKETMKDVK